VNAPYPFSAIVGQENLKLALLLNAVSPEVGGVLVRGEKGTAKSTAVRGLAKLLPPIKVVSGCPYSCDPGSPNPECPAGPHPAGPHPEDASWEWRPVRLVELPVGASTDRLTGTLDIERALTEGEKAFEPGLLAAAHRSILYVDEVNLLSDHLVDLLLDVAAMGTNYVEREGVSVRHPSRFILVGTMNPEEGELRPQLLDRFGITVEVSGNPDADERVEIVRRRLSYETHPEDFADKWAAADAELARGVEESRRRLPVTHLPEETLHKIAALCTQLGVDGLRGDLVTAKAARALAAWEARGVVATEDVRRAALLALAHRRRRDPFEEAGVDPEELEKLLPEDPDPDPPGGGAPPPDGGDTKPQAPIPEPSEARPGTGERTFSAEEGFDPTLLEVPEKGRGGPLGRRSRVVGNHGHPVGDREAGEIPDDLALAATVRAAAPHQRARDRTGPGLVLHREDLRTNVREGREGNLILFVVDASGSMAARKRMSAVKGAVLSLLTDAYQRRDKVAMISFRGEGARILLPPTSGVELAASRLEELPTGGRTPLAAGLQKAAEVLERERTREKERRPLLVILTDGRTTAGPDPHGAVARLRRLGVTSVVVDTEEGYVRLGMAGALAEAMGARCLRLEELRADSLVELVERRRVA
jgi:magnesium chelatase subunit D